MEDDLKASYKTVIEDLESRRRLLRYEVHAIEEALACLKSVYEPKTTKRKTKLKP